MSTANDGVLDLDAAFQSSQSGKGVRLTDIEQLKMFAVQVRSRAAKICNVETFEIRGDLEIPRIGLSIYLGGREGYESSPAEWAAHCEEDLRRILDAIRNEGIRCVFQVWTDDLEPT